MMRIKKKKKLTPTKRKRLTSQNKPMLSKQYSLYMCVCVSACVLQLPKKPTGRKVTSQKPPLPFTLIS